MLVPLAAVAYVVAVDRFPHYSEWIATASLVLSHVQVVGLLGSLAALSHADAQSDVSSAKRRMRSCEFSIFTEDYSETNTRRDRTHT